jgi:hypothetical protein
MMRNGIGVAVVAGVMLASPAQAEQKMTPDIAWVTLSTAAVMLVTMCPAYEAEYGGMQNMADRNGVDYATMLPATMAALQMIMGHPYNRNNLIPAVTRLVNEVAYKSIPQLKTPKGCDEYAKKIDGSGLFKKAK